jgi:hypothetical protein
MTETADGRGREFCAETARESAEQLSATASLVDNWILVEYRGVWGYDAVRTSGLSPEVKAHLLEEARARGRTKVLFVRRTDRRRSETFHVFWGSSPEHGAWMRGAEVEHYQQLLDLGFADEGELLSHPLLLVCTHGKHDRCCARYGRPLYEAVAEQAEAGWAWQCSHVGGDRFAGNLVLLPEGLYFGRVEPAEAWAVLDEYLAGRIHLPTYRGRSCFPPAVQAAELAVRQSAGATGIDDLELVSAEPIRFRVEGRVYEAEVDRVLGELTYLTCSSEQLRHPRRYVARSLRARDA